MTIPAAILDAEQLRVLNSNEPTLGKNQGINLGTLLNDWAAIVKAEAEAATSALSLIVSGQDTILNSATTVVVTVGTQFDGKFAVVSFGEAPTAAVDISSAPVSGGDLTITIDQDNTANLLVNYIIDGR